ncbi:MAG: hypothetical protein Kow00106_23820 [Anaerolineae bacterium]
MPNELILVVDDEPHIIELASLYLKQDGFRVISAADGIEALQRIAQEQPALVVLDLMLPRLAVGKSASASAPNPTCRSSCSPPATTT